jgi:adenosylcobyric acid synthase
MFSSDAFRHAFLSAIKDRAVSGIAYEDGVESALDALADHLEACLDLDALLAL